MNLAMKKLISLFSAIFFFSSVSLFATEYSKYGQTRTHYINTYQEPAYIKFEVQSIGLNKYTKWYVNGSYKETDYSKWYVDPDYTTFCGYGTTKVDAYVYDKNWNYEERHTWYVTITVHEPDLIVLYPNASPSYVNSGSTINLSCTVKNQGNAKADFGTTQTKGLTYYLSTNTSYGSSDIKLATSNLNDFNAGESRNISKNNVRIPDYIQSGTYYIIFYVDQPNYINESNENNNTSYVRIQIHKPAPDLIVKYPSASPSSVNSGGKVRLSCVVKNQGDAKADFGTTQTKGLTYYLSTNTSYNSSDIKLATSNLNDFNAGESRSVTKDNVKIPDNIESGTYYILFYVDQPNYITESNENNNVTYLRINIHKPKPDLIVTSPAANPSLVNSGEKVRLSCIVKNQGDAKADFGTTQTKGLTYYLSTNTSYGSSDIKLATSNLNDFNAGESRSVTKDNVKIPDNIESGTYYILFYVDQPNYITESNENNNVTYLRINIHKPKPDLVVLNPQADPRYVNSGEKIDLSCLVKNQGDAKADFGVTQIKGLTYYLSTNTFYNSSDIKLATTNLNDFDPGEARTITKNEIKIPENIESGTYYILFYVDQPNYITESDETNNISYVDLRIHKKLPDLTIIDTYLSKENLNRGERFNASCTILNQGDGKANFPLFYRKGLQFFLSTDDILDQEDYELATANLNDFGPGESRDINDISLIIPTQVDAGNYYILFCVDKDDKIQESDESNNVFSKAVTIGDASYLFVRDSILNVDFSSGNVSFDLESNIAWTITTDADWITADITSGNGNATIALNYTTNDLSVSRTATVTVSGETGKQVTLIIIQSSQHPELSVNLTSIQAGPEEGDTLLSIQSNTGWSVYDDADWLSITPETGYNNGEINIHYSENNTIYPRSANIYLYTSWGDTIVIAFEQEEKIPQLSILTEDMDLHAEEGDTFISIQSNVSWWTECEDNWVSMDPLSGNQDGTVDIHYLVNPSLTEDRSATVRIYISENEYRSITIHQAHAVFEVSPDDLSFGFESDEERISLATNVSWSLSVDCDWLHTDQMNGQGNTEISLLCDENTHPENRSATVTIYSAADTIFHLSVVQQGCPAQLSTSTDQISVSGTAGSTNLEVLSNTYWNITVEGDWISVQPENGENNSTITINYETNNTGAVRNAWIMVTDQYGDTSKVVITQSYATGIDQNTEPVTTIYPNPTTGPLSIESDVPVTEIRIYSLEGKLVYLRKEEVYRINISDLNAGTYIMKLFSGEGILLKTTKIIKKDY